MIEVERGQRKKNGKSSSPPSFKTGRIRKLSGEEGGKTIVEQKKFDGEGGGLHTWERGNGEDDSPPDSWGRRAEPREKGKAAELSRTERDIWVIRALPGRR